MRRARMLPWRSGMCTVSSSADIPVTEGVVMWLRLAVPDQVGDSLPGRGLVGKAPSRSGHSADSDKHRPYRVDRIQSVVAATRRFVPGTSGLRKCAAHAVTPATPSPFAYIADEPTQKRSRPTCVVLSVPSRLPGLWKHLRRNPERREASPLQESERVVELLGRRTKGHTTSSPEGGSMPVAISGSKPSAIDIETNTVASTRTANIPQHRRRRPHPASGTAARQASAHRATPVRQPVLPTPPVCCLFSSLYF